MKKIISIIAAAAMLTSSGAMLTANAEDSYISEETVDTEALERAYTLIKQFVEDNRALGIGIFVNGGYFDYEKYENPDGAICPDKIECGCYAPYEEQFLALIKPFLAENDIDESLVEFVYADIAIDIYEKGDVNLDTEINVADSTYITQYLAAPDEFLLSDDQKYTADVTGGGDGITAADALAIQQYLTGDTTAIG